MITIPKHQFDGFLNLQEQMQKEIDALLSRVGFSEERNGIPTVQSNTTKAELAESVADVAPSGLNQKNKQKKGKSPAKEPEVAETPVIDRKGIEADIKEWEARKCPSYLNPTNFKVQKEKAIQELRNQLK